MARLAPGATFAQAQSELDAISTQLEAEYPRTNDARAVEVSPLSVKTFGQVRPAVLALMAAVSFVLLIACANVATLLLGRSETRQREIAVRTALGAGWGRLLRLLVTESLLLAGLGAVAGLGLAWVAVRTLVASTPIALPSFATPALSVPVLAFTVAVAVVCGLLLGIAPAVHAASADSVTCSRGQQAGCHPRRLTHVTPGFFDTLGIPLTQGRTYRESELAAGSTPGDGIEPARLVLLVGRGHGTHPRADVAQRHVHRVGQRTVGAGLPVFPATGVRTGQHRLPRRGEDQLRVLGHRPRRAVDTADHVLDNGRRGPQELAGLP